MQSVTREKLEQASKVKMWTPTCLRNRERSSRRGSDTIIEYDYLSPHQTGRADFPHPASARAFATVAELRSQWRKGHRQPARTLPIRQRARRLGFFRKGTMVQSAFSPSYRGTRVPHCMLSLRPLRSTCLPTGRRSLLASLLLWACPTPGRSRHRGYVFPRCVGGFTRHSAGPPIRRGG